MSIGLCFEEYIFSRKNLPRGHDGGNSDVTSDNAITEEEPGGDKSVITENLFIKTFNFKKKTLENLFKKCFKN